MKVSATAAPINNIGLSMNYQGRSLNYNTKDVGQGNFEKKSAFSNITFGENFDFLSKSNQFRIAENNRPLIKDQLDKLKQELSKTKYGTEEYWKILEGIRDLESELRSSNDTFFKNL